MILILSEYADKMTDKVCGWLNHHNFKYLRLNKEDDFYEISALHICNQLRPTIKLTIHNEHYNLLDFTKIWYRRGHFKIKKENLLQHISFPSVLASMHRHIDTEHSYILEFIYKATKPVAINTPLKYNVNKLEALSVASKVGFKIPNTVVTRYGKEVEATLHGTEKITKNIADIFHYHDEEIFVFQHTDEVHTLDSNDVFDFSIFQEKIHKRFEIRVFVFQDIIKSLAFYSPEMNEKNDNRIIQINSVNRVFPYQLPDIVSKKIFELMTQLDLESGSVDLIYDNAEEYIFLEVNPVCFRPLALRMLAILEPYIQE
jgi:hypothetical protein